MVDEHLAAGDAGGYHFRYRIASSPNADTPEGDGFELSATPNDYGKVGKRSFFLDAAGKIHGEDRHGEIASVSDPVLPPAAQPSDVGTAAAVQ